MTLIIKEALTINERKKEIRRKKNSISTIFKKEKPFVLPEPFLYFFIVKISYKVSKI
jgi:hypothetical protein